MVSDEHQLPIVFRVLSVGLDELRDSTTHQVGLVDLMFLTDSVDDAFDFLVQGIEESEE